MQNKRYVSRQAGRINARRMWEQQRGYLLAVSTVVALSLLLILAPAAQATQAPTAPDKSGQSQIFNGDLEVEEGQVLRGDVSVYSGDVDVQEGGLIEGNLNVYSGDVEIEEGGRVNGDVTAWSGDMQVDGHVGGDLTSMAGDIEIGGSAFVGGNISVLAGQVKQRAGAEVGGNVLRGRDIKLPSPPAIGLLPWLNNSPNAPGAPPVAGRDGFMNQPLGFLGRTLTGLLLLGLFVAGAAAIAAFRPRWTGEVQGVLQRQAALSFATGLIANVLMLAVIGFLYITICLRPPGLLLAVGLLAFNVAGMAAVGAELGGRLSERLGGQWTQTSRTALGVFVPGAIIVFLWAVGGCLGFFGNMGALLLGSFGVGSILVKTLNLGTSTPAGGQMTPVEEAPNTPAPVTPVTPVTAAAPVAETRSGDSPAVPSPSVDASAAPPAAAMPFSETPATETPVKETPVKETPVDDTSIGDRQSIDTPPAVVPTADLPASAPPSAASEQWWVSATDLVQEEKPPVAAGQDDFTRIEGIGPKLSQRLHAANIHTFADLAALPPETAAGVLGWTSERLLRTRILEQALELAARKA